MCSYSQYHSRQTGHCLSHNRFLLNQDISILESSLKCNGTEREPNCFASELIGTPLGKLTVKAL